MGFLGGLGGASGGGSGGSLSNAVGGRLRAIYGISSKLVGVWGGSKQGSGGGTREAKTHAPARPSRARFPRWLCQVWVHILGADRHP